MAETIIDNMSRDLGLFPFQNESNLFYKSRVVYSGLASQIKAISLDKSIEGKMNNVIGVSRRYVKERSCVFLDTMCKIYPEISDWFYVENDRESPANLVRKRLLQHGELINVGFDTNIILSRPYTKQIYSDLEVVYGEILGQNIKYSGIATTRENNIQIPIPQMIGIKEWLEKFIKEARWSKEILNLDGVEYFNPSTKTKNNYKAWGGSIPYAINKLILARISLNKNDYEYYLIKPEEKLLHKIDPFLKKQGYHKKIMYALRYMTKNMVCANVEIYNSHIILKLNATLPEKESILLSIYAWPIKNISDKLSWTMTYNIWEFIKPYIENLGIKIKEENNG